MAIHDYRSRSGEVFYAAAQQPSIPIAVAGEVIRFTPRTSSHPSAVNMIIAQLMGNSANSLTWNKSAAQ